MKYVFLKISSLFFLAINICFAQTIHVFKDKGSDENDGSSWEYPLKTIQKAVDMAGPGDVIIVRKSIEPYGPVKIQKSGLENMPITIRGEVSEDPPIVTAGRELKGWSSTYEEGVWKIQSNEKPMLLIGNDKALAHSNDGYLKPGQWLWINKFIFYKPSNGKHPDTLKMYKNAFGDGVELRNSSWIVLKDLRIQLGGSAGIELVGSNYNTLENIHVRWFWQGIRISENSSHNVVLDVLVEENREGIYILSGSSYNKVMNCKVFRNGNPPFWDKGDRGGVLIGQKGPNNWNTVEGCEIAYNGGPDSDPALIAYRSPYTVFKNNYIHDNYGSGLFVTIWSNNSVVVGNRVIGNGKKAVEEGYKGISGLSIRRSRNVLVKNNTIYNNHVSPDSRWEGKDLGPKGGLDLQGNSNDIMDNIRFINNCVSGTVGGPDFYISKIPHTPGLIVK